jgi:uncharacterized membrane protein
MYKIKHLFLAAFAWAVGIFTGAIVFNTLVFYPNIFRQVPESLELTMAFLKVRGPHHFFPPFGAILIVCNMVLVAVWWRTKQVRNLLLLSMVIYIVFEFIFSVTFFWEKNTIMFIEGQSKHSINFLQSTADSFQKWHWVRVIASTAASILIFVSYTLAIESESGSNTDN